MIWNAILDEISSKFSWSQTPLNVLPLTAELPLKTVEISSSIHRTCQEVIIKSALPLPILLLYPRHYQYYNYSYTYMYVVYHIRT